MSRGELFAIDHGQALPSVQGVTSRAAYPYASHIAWPVVERVPGAMGEHTDALRALDDAAIDRAVALVPAGWWSAPDRAPLVRDALRDRRDRLPDTLDGLMERLG